MKTTKIMLGCAVSLLGLSAAFAQDEAPPAEPEAAAEPTAAPASEGNAWTALEGRWYVTPALSWVFADDGRRTDDGPGVSLAVGHPFGDVFTLEGFAQFNQFDHKSGSDTAELIGVGVNSLVFPTRKAPAYLLLGAGYGDVSSHPGGEESYGTLLLNVGVGYWWKPFDLFFKGMSLRTETVWRIDAHNDSRTGSPGYNGRKAFDDILLNVGLNIPIGEVAAPPPPPAEPPPVEVVAAAAPPDTDGDGVTDDLDQCPDTPAGTAVDASGCPAVAAPKCKTPEPGEKLDLAGCGTGDVIVLKGVNFDFNKDRLTANAKAILDGVDEALKASPSTNVELGGHTDGKGGDAYNQALSERRACSVARYLKGHGIDAGRMSPVGYGESKPIADNETDEGREQNRRVELKILDGPGTGLSGCAASSAPRAAAAPALAPAVAAEPAAAIEPATEPTPEPAAEAAAEASTPAPEPAPETAPAAEPAPAPVSSGAMQQVPESEVFGTPSSSAPAAAAPTQQVPESEVFGAAPAPAAAASPTQTQMVPASEVFDGK